MKFHIVYRLCDKVDAVNGLPRPFNLKKADVIKVCYKSLVKAMADLPWDITVLADDITQETHDWVSARLPKESRILEFKPAIKNLGSLLKAYEIADGFTENGDWIYFLEDDYLHEASSFKPRILDFLMFAEAYKFALPIFIHPTDYPDQYTRLLSRSYLFQTNFGYWREVCSTTGTFMCSVATYKQFGKYFKECGTDDGALSKIFKTKALCFSPMPGLATHMHQGVMSNYVNWEQITKDLSNES